MEIAFLADHPHLADEVARRNYLEWTRLYEAAGISLGQLTSLMRERCTRDRVPFALVALHDHELIGAVGVKLEEPTSIEGLSPWIAGLLVQHHARGSGVGRALLAQAERVAAGLGVETLYLSCEPKAESFYVRAGWQLRERVLSLGDRVAVMQKRIA
jgi:GNAT superfamily N-acetyltransferase